ncbi:GNS1 SUR4 membrane protein domain containing protein [Aphelenchoides bicaudatus]|nr:GNS1 SUR4 membrane protein domain containing protein [Aphelenchoides bicaudatus]
MEHDSSLRTWESAGYKISYIPYEYKHVFGLEAKYWNPHSAHRFILDHWHLSFLIGLVYVVVIHALQFLMRDRKPFNLKQPLVLWNTFLALFSLIGTVRVAEESINVFLTRKHGLHDSICITYDPAGIASLWCFLFIGSKVIELFDTVFICLKKRKLIFLHWYHHAAVLMVSWSGAQMIIAPSRLFILMNYTVHTFMYTYYAVTASGIRLNRPIAMFVTTIQNLQMLGGVLIAFYVAKVRWVDREFCHMSSENLIFCFFVYLTFGILFCRFFINAYLRRTAEKTTGVTKLEEKKLN